MKTSLIVSRYETYPKDNPQYIVVGFKIICESLGKHEYIEAEIPLNQASGLSEHEICNLAHKKIKNKISKARERIVEIKTVIGAEFIPDESDENNNNLTVEDVPVVVNNDNKITKLDNPSLDIINKPASIPSIKTSHIPENLESSVTTSPS